MKKVGIKLLLCGMLGLGIASSCNNNATKEKEPEIVSMDSLKDSLKHHQEVVDKDIENVKKSMENVDKEFKN